MNISQAVIKRIEELCKERNLTINALSNISGVTQSTVNDIVKGTTYNAGIATIKNCVTDSEYIRITAILFNNLEQEVK